MSMGLVFWIIMLLWLIFMLLWHWPNSGIGPWGPWGNSIILFILFLLLGWHAFGAPIR